MSSSTSGRILLVRHGESEGNATRTFTDSTEVPLTDLGRLQARRAADIIATRFSPVLVVASPYTRAHDTGKIIAARLNLDLQVEEQFREQWLGTFRGRPYDSVASDPAFDATQRWAWRPAEGESLVDVQDRVVPALARVALEHSGRDVIVVSHGGVMLALWAHLIGSWKDAQASGNAAVVLVEHDGERFGGPQVIDEGGAGKDIATLETGG